jgi:hypothetical protein
MVTEFIGLLTRNADGTLRVLRRHVRRRVKWVIDKTLARICAPYIIDIVY